MGGGCSKNSITPVDPGAVDPTTAVEARDAHTSSSTPGVDVGAGAGAEDVKGVTPTGQPPDSINSDQSPVSTPPSAVGASLDADSGSSRANELLEEEKREEAAAKAAAEVARQEAARQAAKLFAAVRSGDVDSILECVHALMRPDMPLTRPGRFPGADKRQCSPGRAYYTRVRARARVRAGRYPLTSPTAQVRTGRWRHIRA